MKKRFAALFAAMLICFSLLGGYRLVVESDAAVKTLTLEELQEKFPSGKYWNHVGSDTNNPDGYTSTPCRHHGSCSWRPGGCECNSFDGAVQCYGFILKLAYDSYGESARKRAKVKTLDGLKVGDIVVYRGYYGSNHYIFVTAIEGNTVYFADANGTGGQDCKIRWGGRKSLSELNSKLVYVMSAPYALNNSSHGDSAPSVEYIKGEYTVSTGDKNIPLNIREGAGTNYKLLGQVPNGTVINVEEVYGVWGKITYNGITGWVCLTYGKQTAPSRCDVTVESANIDLSQPLKINLSSDQSVIYSVNVVLKNSVETTTLYRSKIEESFIELDLSLGGEYIITVTAINSAGTVESKSVSVHVDYCPGNYMVTATSSNLTVRSGPARSYSKIGSLADSTEIKVTEIDGLWGKISYYGNDGWVCLEYTKYLIPEEDEQLPPSEVSLTTNPEEVYYGDTVTFSVMGRNIETCSFEIEKDEKPVVSEEIIEDRYEYTFEEVGVYNVNCVAKNKYGDTALEPKPIHVAPEKAAPTVETDSSGVFATWLPCKGADSYVAGVKDMEGKDVVTPKRDFVGGDLSFSAELPAGNYQLYIEAYSENANVKSVYSLDFVIVKDTVDGGETFERGDVDGNGSIDLQDAMFIIMFVSKKVDESSITDAMIDAGDINGDSKLDLGDAMAIIMFVAKKIDSLSFQSVITGDAN